MDGFWVDLVSGRNLVTAVPADRWDAARHHGARGVPATTYSSWGAFLDRIWDFDCDRFGIPPTDALVMDPHQRLVLELVDEVWARAGYVAHEWAGSRTGVWIGGGESTYVRKEPSSAGADHGRRLLVNTIPNMIAGRVADVFDLRGPAQVVDTACSSSLVAVHQACQALRSGECDAAVVGGVELITDPYLHVAFSQAEVLSPDDRTRVFDEHAAGFVLGEGAGVMLLRPLTAALAAGDQVLGVLRGSAVNNDGRTMGVTVPSSDGQRAVIEAALAAAGVSGRSVGYLEAHGTGTLLGDPIEIRAAAAAYGGDGGIDGRWCAVGSVKSNLGHQMRAAGIAALTKAVLAVQRGHIPPTLHCERPHPRFRFDRTPFVPVVAGRAWSDHDGPRRAGVSSFGFGGTNCHVVCEQPPAHVPVRVPLDPPMLSRRHFRLDRSEAPRPDPVRDLLEAVGAGGLNADAAFVQLVNEEQV